LFLVGLHYSYGLFYFLCACSWWVYTTLTGLFYIPWVYNTYCESVISHVCTLHLQVYVACHGLLYFLCTCSWWVYTTLTGLFYIPLVYNTYCESVISHVSTPHLQVYVACHGLFYFLGACSWWVYSVFYASMLPFMFYSTVHVCALTSLFYTVMCLIYLLWVDSTCYEFVPHFTSSSLSVKCTYIIPNCIFSLLTLSFTSANFSCCKASNYTGTGLCFVKYGVLCLTVAYNVRSWIMAKRCFHIDSLLCVSIM